MASYLTTSEVEGQPKATSAAWLAPSPGATLPFLGGSPKSWRSLDKTAPRTRVTGLLRENPLAIVELLRALAHVPSYSRRTHKDPLQSLQYPWRSPLHPLQQVLRCAGAAAD